MGEREIEFGQVADIARGGLLTCFYEVLACKSSKAQKNYWLCIVAARLFLRFLDNLVLSANDMFRKRKDHK